MAAAAAVEEYERRLRSEAVQQRCAKVFAVLLQVQRQDAHHTRTHTQAAHKEAHDCSQWGSVCVCARARVTHSHQIVVACVCMCACV